jgi:hypothetical protein
LRATQVANMAPRTICPSTPTFHWPAVKVMLIPTPHRMSSTQAATTSATLVGLSKAPDRMLRYASPGGAPTATRISVVNRSARRIGARLRRMFMSFDEILMDRIACCVLRRL